MNTIQQANAHGKVAIPGGLGFIAWLNIIGGISMIIRIFGNHHINNAGAFLLLMGLVSVLIGVGLLGLKRWALVTAIGGYIVNILFGLASQNPIAVIVPAAILCYLCSKKVRTAFFPSPAQPALPRVTDVGIDVETNANKV